MVNPDSKKYYGSQRTEEVQHIINRMPTSFGIWITCLLLLIFFLCVFFGWKVRYPDVVNGEITINSNFGPVKLVSNNYGKLTLNGYESQNDIKEGKIIAYIQNSAKLKDVLLIDSLLKTYTPNNPDISQLKRIIPDKLALGEINSQYYAFLNSLQLLSNYREDELYKKKEKSLKELLNQQDQAIHTTSRKLNMSLNSLKFIKKFHDRDSILFKKHVISESELDKSEIDYSTGKDNYESSLSALITDKEQLNKTLSDIQELSIQKVEKEKELKMNLVATYNDLHDNIVTWQHKYVFIAPFSGKIQFLKFWKNNDYIESGTAIFTIIPYNKKVSGQVTLPASGSGKVKVGQEVIIKLDNYPYMEFGSVKGKVNQISLTTSAVKTDKGSVETYLVSIDFPEGLKTNYGKMLDFKYEIKGTADIITSDRKLFERLFDNLKYSLVK